MCWPRPWCDLWPGAQYAIGPAIADGFYYDFALPGGATFSDEDLERISTRMRAIMAEDQPFVRQEHSLEEGLELFADQPFKREIISGVGDDVALQTEASADIVPGAAVITHVPQHRTASSTSAVGLTSRRPAGSGISPCCGWPVPTGAATRSDRSCSASTARPGNPNGPWPTTSHLLEEAERRDHRRLGAELDLFSFPSEIGSGLAVFHPKGGIIRRLMEDYSRPTPRGGGLRVRLHARTSPSPSCSRSPATCSPSPKGCSRPWSWTRASATT